MRCIPTLILILLFLPVFIFGQPETSIEQYHIIGNRRYIPMSIAHYQNKNQWYAEGRYNYEEVETFSFYVGKTFSRKNRLSYDITPLFGGAIGNFNGLATGVNIDVDYRKFFLSVQSQYSFSTDQSTDNFFYNWSEFVYQPVQWLYGGVAIQHTHLFDAQTSYESGLLLGFSYRNFTVPVYTFSPFNQNRYFMVGLTIEWQRSPVSRLRDLPIAERNNK